MDQFYVTCPSNSSMSLHPDNTLSRFTVSLNTDIELNGQWEVGMCEMQYPISWHNIREGHNSFVLRESKEKNREPGRRGKSFIQTKKIPPGYYSVEELIAKMKKLCTGRKLDELGIDISYDSATRRVTINTKMNEKRKNRGSIKLRHDIANLLGFNGDKTVKANMIAVSSYAALPSAGFHTMYVYSDIVEQQIVGHEQAPLLRVLPIEDQRSAETFVSKTFSKIYYLPLSKKRITDIEFLIVDDTGRQVGFDYGKVVIVLHFRRKNL